MRPDSSNQRLPTEATNSRGRLRSLTLAVAISLWGVQALGAQAAPETRATTTSPAAPSAMAPFAHTNQFSLLAGLNQLALRGGNIEATWYTSRLSFEYSHGFDLHLTGSVLGTAEQDQHVQLLQTWTTGFGIGYRVTPDLDVRLESKLHRYQVFYESQRLAGTPITAYTTETEGLGAYYRLYPFGRVRGWARGIVIAPSARYWPNVWTSLPKGGYTYANAVTGRTETLKAATQGIPGTTGLFVNASLGYTF